jgi:Flp pilus assembly pilin Flp
MSVRAFF